jgi:hypothetical protein
MHNLDAAGVYLALQYLVHLFGILHDIDAHVEIHLGKQDVQCKALFLEFLFRKVGFDGDIDIATSLFIVDAATE